MSQPVTPQPVMPTATASPSSPDPSEVPAAPPTSAPRAGRDLVVLTDLRKRYNVGQPNEAEVLHGLNLRLATGEFAALIGPSGSGKSTLLNILGLLEPATSGRYVLDGQSVAELDDEALTRLRRDTLGFVFQFHHLLPAFTALENVLMPVLARDGRIGPRERERARSLLDAVGLAHAMDRVPGALSGGMQQRVAMARALMLEPKLVLADEPTGNLDRSTADGVFDLMLQLARNQGTAFVMVTHDESLAARCHRVVRLTSGVLR